MMGIEESEDEDHDSDAVGGEGELGVVNTLRCSPPRVLKTRANGFIHSQLASSRVPTAEVVGDNDARVVHQKQHHVPYSLAILINGIFLLKYGIASTLWAFQYVFSCT